MKKPAVICRIAVVMLVVGVALFSMSFLMTGCDVNKLSTEPEYKSQTYYAQGVLSSISINDQNCVITVNRSYDDFVRIEYQENKYNTYSISESNGRLSFEKQVDEHINLLTVSLSAPSLDIFLPADFSGDIELITTNAKIELDNISAALVYCQTKNAKIDIEKLSCRQLSAVSANGSVKLSTINCTENLIAETTNAHIEFDGVWSGGGIVCTTNNGHIELENLAAASLDVNTSNAEVSIENINIENNISVNTSNAKVEFEDIYFGSQFECVTTNGRVEGELSGRLSDYSFDCKTTNAFCSLPEKTFQDGNRSVYIRTTNGAVSVEFDN